MKQMKTSVSFIFFIFFIFSHTSFSQNNTLTENEKEQGWMLLFDGKTINGWTGFNLDSITPNWAVVDGTLHADGSKGDIVSNQQFEDFELKVEWKISKGGNSGIFYHVKEAEVFTEIWRTGIEMQVMDNANNPMAENPKKSAASLYAMYAPTKDATQPAGEWNNAKILVENGKVEYWINEQKVNQYKLWTNKWYADREKCLHNKTRKPLWGEFRTGHIALQDEGFPVAYRNIKIRKIEIPNKNKQPDFLPVTYIDENQPKYKEGHHIHNLLNQWWGTTNGFNSLVGVYTSKDFVITATHTDQQMFYVIEGKGWALVGEKIFPIFPGACWFVPPNKKHGIKCAANCKEVKAFVVHGAP